MEAGSRQRPPSTTLEMFLGCLVCVVLTVILLGLAGTLGYWVDQWWGVVFGIGGLLLLSLGAVLWLLGRAARVQTTGNLSAHPGAEWGSWRDLAQGHGDWDDQDKPHGLWQWRTPAGTLLQETEYVHGIKEGRETLFYVNGQPECVGEYLGGARTGCWQKWYREGQLAEERWFVHDQEEGLARSWYPNGGRGEEINYVGGQRQGLARFWHANGELREQGEYVLGERHGRWQRWHGNGLLASIEHRNEGQLHGKCSSWDEQGQLREQVSFRGGEKHGGEMRWHVNGVKAFAGGNRRDRAHGKWCTWDDQGHLLSEVHYHRGQLHGSWRRWYSDGRLAVDAHYARGLLNGGWAEYRPDGTLWSTVHFRHGVPLERGVLRFRDPQTPAPAHTARRWRLLYWAVVLLLNLALLVQAPAMLVGILALLGVITIHEYGHYLAAWLVGIPIKIFRVGAGPVLTSVQLGATRFELSLLPFWGYVLPYELRRGQIADYHAARRAFRRGKEPPAPPLGNPSRHVASERVTRPRQLVFLLGGVSCNIALALVFLCLTVYLPPSRAERRTLYLDSVVSRWQEEKRERSVVRSARMGELQITLKQKATRTPSPLTRQRTEAHIRAEIAALRADLRRVDATFPQISTLLADPPSSVDRRVREPQPRKALASRSTEDILARLGEPILEGDWKEAFTYFAVTNLAIALVNLVPIPPLDGYKALVVFIGLIIRRDLPTRVRDFFNVIGCLFMLVLLVLSVISLLQMIINHLLGIDLFPVLE